MTPQEMLIQLDDEGMNAACDFNDELDGWFGWKVNPEDMTITVTFQNSERTSGSEMVWHLTPEVLFHE